MVEPWLGASWFLQVCPSFDETSTNGHVSGQSWNKKRRIKNSTMDYSTCMYQLQVLRVERPSRDYYIIISLYAAHHTVWGLKVSCSTPLTQFPPTRVKWVHTWNFIAMKFTSICLTMAPTSKMKLMSLLFVGQLGMTLSFVGPTLCSTRPRTASLFMSSMEAAVGECMECMSSARRRASTDSV
jgi:hypothetical protein